MSLGKGVLLAGLVVVAFVVALFSFSQEKSATAKSTKAASPVSRPPNPPPITINACRPDTTAPVHGPKKSQNGVVTFTAVDGDYTIIFEKPDVFGIQTVPIVQNTDVGIHVSAEPSSGSTSETHFCFQGKGLCSKSCPPADGNWSNWLPKREPRGGPRSDPNDIIVP